MGAILCIQNACARIVSESTGAAAHRKKSLPILCHPKAPVLVAAEQFLDAEPELPDPLSLCWPDPILERSNLRVGRGRVNPIVQIREIFHRRYQRVGAIELTTKKGSQRGLDEPE